MFKDLLILLAILILQIEHYRNLRQTLLRHIMAQGKKAKRLRKPAVLRPKVSVVTCRGCRFCQEGKRKRKVAAQGEPIPWQLRIGKDGPKKKVAIGGYFCPNLAYENNGICDEVIHALVEYGGQGVHEEICGFKCQACWKKLTRGRTR